VVLEHVYGPGDKTPKFVPTILQAARRGTLADLKITAGEQSKDWLFVEDAVSAFELILDRSLEEKPGYREYSAGSGHATSLRKFVEVVAEVFGQDCPVFGSRPYSANEIWESYADLSALIEIGYIPKFSVRAGVERCFNETA
jgi:nucleoside-diphosphate-sugar epimerase